MGDGARRVTPLRPSATKWDMILFGELGRP